MRLSILLFAAITVATTACGPASREETPPEPPVAEADTKTPEEPSRAADDLIETARTPEERATLERARDEVDAEMREEVEALDAEIERLRKENEALKREAKR